MDVPAPQAGTVGEVKVKVGDRVVEGDLIVAAGGRGRGRHPAQGADQGRRRPALGRARRLRLPAGVYETIEVKVPDIGDFKDVPVIEVHVQPRAPTIKAEDPLMTLESDKATMDVPSPAARHGRRASRSRSATGSREGDADPARCRPVAAKPAAAAASAAAAAGSRPRAPTPQGRQRRGKGDYPRRGAGARRRARRLHRRLPRRRSRQEGGAGRALADAWAASASTSAASRPRRCCTPPR